MNYLNLLRKIIFIVPLIFFLTACVPFNSAERAAVSISNKTNTELIYQLQLSGQWSTSEKLGVNESSYVFQYDDSNAVFDTPQQLEGVRIGVAECSVTMGTKELRDHLVRDSEGRFIWDLIVTKQKLKLLGCQL